MSAMTAGPLFARRGNLIRKLLDGDPTAIGITVVVAVMIVVGILRACARGD